MNVASFLLLLSAPTARKSASSLAIRITGLALGFLQAVLCARLLGAEGYGMLALALAVAQIAATVALLGLHGLAVRRVAELMAVKALREIRSFTGRALAIAAMTGLGASLILAGAAVAFAGWLAPYDGVLLAASLLVLPVALIQLFRGVTQGAGATVRSQLPGDIIRPALFCAALLIVAATGTMLTPSFGLLLLAAAWLLATAIGGVWCRTAISRPEIGRPDDVAPFRLLAAAIPFLGLNLGAIAMAEAGTLLLGLFAPPDEVGIYQPAARLLVLMTVPIQAAAIAFAPRIAELNARGEIAAISALTRRFTLVTTVGTVVVSLAMALTAPWLLALFGGEFASAAPLVWIFALTQIAHAACGPVGYLMTMTGRTGSALRGQLAGLTANLVGGVVLVYFYGAPGAAMAASFGILVWNFVLVVMVRRQFHFDPTLVSAFRRAPSAV